MSVTRVPAYRQAGVARVRSAFPLTDAKHGHGNGRDYHLLIE